MALTKRSIATIRKVVDAIHLARLAHVRQHRAEISAVEDTRATIRATSRDALDIREGDAVNFTALAGWTNWADRMDGRLSKEQATLESGTDALVLTAIRSLGQTRAVEHLEQELKREQKKQDERVADRSMTALSVAKPKQP